jgi:hypothetical protein
LVFCKESALLVTSGAGSPYIYSSMYDIATTKCIADNIPTQIGVSAAYNQGISASVSADKLSILYTFNQSQAKEAYGIDSVTRHLSCEQIYFLMLAEYAYLNNMHLDLESVPKLQFLYDSLDKEIQEHYFNTRYGKVMQKSNRNSYCIIS